MVEIKVWKKTYKEKEIDVLIRNIGEVWEYLFIWNSKIYSAYMEAKIPFWRKFGKEKYKDKEIEGAINLVFIMAKTTIDELTKKENEKR